MWALFPTFDILFRDSLTQHLCLHLKQCRKTSVNWQQDRWVALRFRGESVTESDFPVSYENRCFANLIARTTGIVLITGLLNSFFWNLACDVFCTGLFTYQRQQGNAAHSRPYALVYCFTPAVEKVICIWSVMIENLLLTFQLVAHKTLEKIKY